MRWEGRRESGNIEDRRGMGMGVGLPVGGGLGGLVLLLLISWLTGTNPLDLISTSSVPQDQTVGTTGVPDNDPQAKFISVVLADTEDTWREIFRQMGRRYEDPHLVLFSGAVQSACGLAQAAVGPFYCPPDRKVFIDLSFYKSLQDRLGAPGDFAQAYVIAHEVGHHVQNLLGIADRVHAQRTRARPADANALQVRMELQADCFAGVWASNAERSRHILEEGDIEEGLNAAAAIGDDRLQRQSQGYVVPESFTHGSSAQRVRWFKRGLESGSPRECDTFGAAQL